MVYRFGGFELDEEKRELRLNGDELPLQPRSFHLLVYLVQNRERVVSKDELLEKLWPDVLVVDGALQRAVSLVRSALDQGGAREVIRTYARQGYRFCADVAGEGAIPSGARSPVEPTPAGDGVLARARGACERCDWGEAARLFQEADRETALKAADLECWAHAAQCAGCEPEALGPLQRAVVAHSAVGDRRGAARAALVLAQIQIERREAAVARGWHQRAARLLAAEATCREHGLLEWLGSRFAAAEGELEEAVRRAERTVTLGRELEDADLEALGLLYWGLALLAVGDVRNGLALQDEAAASALAGGVSPWVGGTVYCGILWGCRNRADWDRAAQWTDQFSRWCEESNLSGYPGLCRLHRAEVLCVRGELAEAEAEIRTAGEQLARSCPWAEGDALRVQGEICLARGDLAAAEAAFRRAYELGWDPQPGYALLHLILGRAEAAVRGLERALDSPRWANRQRRGILLAHLVRAATAAGQDERARAALQELEAHPDLYSTPALAAELAFARAEVCCREGARTEALGFLRQAVEIWQETGAPLQAAAARIRLAELLAAEGDAEGAELMLAAAEAAYRKAGTLPATGKQFLPRDRSGAAAAVGSARRSAPPAS